MTDDSREAALPPTLETEALLEHLRAADGLLLCVDFDGTLTVVEDDPAAPDIPADTADALRRLTNSPRVRVAVLSGRALSDLRSRVGVRGIDYVGNHGLERRRDGETVVPEAAAQHRPALEELIDALEDRLSTVDGALVEDKELTATVHYRRVADDRTEAVRSTVEETIDRLDLDGIEGRVGRSIVELVPDVPHDKGSVVRTLTDEVGSNWFTIYLGDDTTDEDVFRELAGNDRELGVHIGDDPDTAAARRLPDPRAVQGLLAWLAEEGVSQLG